MAITAIPCASRKGFKNFVHIDGELTQNSVDEDLLSVRTILKKKGGLFIDSSEVTRCDGAGVQLLSAFLAELDRLQRPVIIEQVSSQLDEICVHYGIDLLQRYSKEHCYGGER